MSLPSDNTILPQVPETAGQATSSRKLLLACATLALCICLCLSLMSIAAAGWLVLR
jgi:hypothetical protein